MSLFEQSFVPSKDRIPISWQKEVGLKAWAAYAQLVRLGSGTSGEVGFLVGLRDASIRLSRLQRQQLVVRDGEGRCPRLREERSLWRPLYPTLPIEERPTFQQWVRIRAIEVARSQMISPTHAEDRVMYSLSRGAIQNPFTDLDT
jgi:hypothetical protein